MRVLRVVGGPGRASLLLLAVAATVTGCDIFEPPPASTADGEACSTRCHGGAQGLAPPFDTRQRTDPALASVGAHEAHAKVGSTMHKDVECSECHVVPKSVADPGHLDSSLPAEVAFGALATADGAAPTYSNGACANTYCHGATLYPGGTKTTPTWTAVGSGEADCGTCHGLPPALPHAQVPQCAACHHVIDRDGVFLEPQRHCNGAVETTFEPVCGDCHGSKANAAPAPDLDGRSDTARPSVGAHASHLAHSTWRADIECNECHVVPVSVYEAGHFDTPRPAEITWGPLARAHGASPVYEGGRCASVYCHGGTPLTTGGTLTEPVWTRVDGTQAACGACHGSPPPLPHAPRSDCWTCHPTIAADGEIASPERHVDGAIDVDVSRLGCTSCHGANGNPAPPTDTAGHTDTTSVGVGAHAAHLGASDWHREGKCEDCHEVPSTIFEKGHLDSPKPAEVTFGAIASKGGSKPAWTGTTCTGVYCHGAANEGGAHTSPTWTKVDGSQVTCGSCHGMPPGGKHPPSAQCWNCHTMVGNGPGGPVITDPSRHIDGLVQTL